MSVAINREWLTEETDIIPASEEQVIKYIYDLVDYYFPGGQQDNMLAPAPSQQIIAGIVLEDLNYQSIKIDNHLVYAQIKKALIDLSEQFSRFEPTAINQATAIIDSLVGNMITDISIKEADQKENQGSQEFQDKRSAYEAAHEEQKKIIGIMGKSDIPFSIDDFKLGNEARLVAIYQVNDNVAKKYYFKEVAKRRFRELKSVSNGLRAMREKYVGPLGSTDTSGHHEA